MPRPITIPQQLRDRPITTSQAAQAGVSATVLRRRFTQLFRGVWWYGPPPNNALPWFTAAILVMPHDAVISHMSALRLLGIDLGSVKPVHVSTRGSGQSRHEDITLHRRLGSIWVDEVHGLRVTTPERTFVDSACYLGLRDLVRAGDALVHSGLITLETLIDFVTTSHLDGVVRARRAAALVVQGAESFRETDVRLLLRFARLPVDGCNLDIHDEAGRFLARGDILFRAFKVLVEYDGWHHERDAKQRQKDHRRRERLEAAGWIVIVITAEDLRDPLGVVRRVHHALLRRGYTGRPPVMSETWHRWFISSKAA